MRFKINFSKPSVIYVWQSLFLLFGTTWLWAPQLNHLLSYRTTLISQYEASFLAYSWVFRIGDALAAILLLLLASSVLSLSTKNKVPAIFLLVIGAGMLIDPLFATSCYISGDTCREYATFNSVIHGIETIITAAALFLASAHDAWKRKSLTSYAFVGMQIIYGLIFASQFASHNQFNTPSQFFYQATALVWLAWYCRELVQQNLSFNSGKITRLTRISLAGWAFFNGVLAIVASLAHIQISGRIEGLFFANNQAWLAQHGVIVGIIMLYLGRHLARGEARARQIFLALTGLEIIKYSAISPHGWLLTFYIFSFVALFVLKDYFNRGVIPLSLRLRIKDALLLLIALLSAVLISLLILLRSGELSEITFKSIDNFFDYTISNKLIPHSDIKSALLAHTILAFIAGSLAAILWVLFKPSKILPANAENYQIIYSLIQKYGSSPEDYFKYWPRDKNYKWFDEQSFIAYKKSGAIIFALPDSVGPPNTRKAAIISFVAWVRAHRNTVCFLPIYSPEGLKKYTAAGLESMQIGSSALIDIKTYADTTVKDKWWRWQKNRAEKKGYQFFEAQPPHSKDFLKILETISNQWLQEGNRKERAYGMGYFDYAYLQSCQINYLKNTEGEIVAFSNVLPKIGDGKTVSIDLLRYLPGADGAMPYLLMQTILSLNNDGVAKYFDLGFVPFSKTNSMIITALKKISSSRFSASGLEQFKNKFDPVWVPAYMAYDGDLGDLAAIAINIERVMEP